jgi:hypothetical protein
LRDRGDLAALTRANPRGKRVSCAAGRKSKLCLPCNAKVLPRDATLIGEILTCARCGRGFDLPRAGRALGSEQGQLEPVPLLGRAGTKVKVALAP